MAQLADFLAHALRGVRMLFERCLQRVLMCGQRAPRADESLLQACEREHIRYERFSTGAGRAFRRNHLRHHAVAALLAPPGGCRRGRHVGGAAGFAHIFVGGGDDGTLGVELRSHVGYREQVTRGGREGIARLEPALRILELASLVGREAAATHKRQQALGLRCAKTYHCRRGEQYAQFGLRGSTCALAAWVKLGPAGRGVWRRRRR